MVMYYIMHRMHVSSLSHGGGPYTCGSTSMQEGRNMHPMYGVFSPRWEHLEKSNLNLVMMKIHC